MQQELYRDILLKRKEEILKIMNNLQKEFSDVNSCDIKEDVDFASCSSNSENNYYIIQNQKKELLEIEEALDKLNRGEYGICQMCEETINPERLKVKPFAKYCIDCREFLEKEQKLR